MLIVWPSLITLAFAASFIFSIESLDCRIPFRNIAHRAIKAARPATFAINEQFDFRISAERLKEFPQCAFCHVKGNISNVKLHEDLLPSGQDWELREVLSTPFGEKSRYPVECD